MTNRTYTTTAEIERSRILWENSVLLATRTEGCHQLLLYLRYPYYVEVRWHTHFNVPLQVTTFTGTERLDPYLENIPLAALFS